MPHPFSNALYYPTIDIHNTQWLKTAALFWDSISTIVPQSIDFPYQENDTMYLFDVGFLRPLRINSYDEAVIGIERDVISLLSSPEIIQHFFYNMSPRYTRIHQSKMSYAIREAVNDIQRHLLHQDKLSMRIRDSIKYISENHDDFYCVNDAFASFYMTALASKLCESHTLALITEKNSYFTAANSMKYGNQSLLLANRQTIPPELRDRELAQGILLNYIIQGLSISPETTLDEIIHFKDSHRDELGHFKAELAELTKSYDDTNLPIDVIQNEIKDIYENQFRPAYNDLKSALSGVNIKWLTDSIFNISVFSAGEVSIPVALLGFSVGQALYAGLSASVIASTIKYNVEKQQYLHNNPYSYLFLISREW